MAPPCLQLCLTPLQPELLWSFCRSSVLPSINPTMPEKVEQAVLKAVIELSQHAVQQAMELTGQQLVQQAVQLAV